MIKKILLVVLACVLIGIAGWWFWSLGTITIVGNGNGIVLAIERPEVEVRRNGGDWEAGTDGMALSVADEVRTGEEGRAAIIFFGEAETTLREGSHVRIADAVHDLESAPRIRADIELVSGRVWSRVLQLFDLESSFSVRTDNVVATVRGTAFDVGTDSGETGVWVADSRVELIASGDSGESIIVPEGWKTTRRANGQWGALEKMNDDDLTIDWFTRNRAADDAFRKRILERTQLKLQHASAPRPSIGRLIEWSEKLHLLFAKEGKNEMDALFVGRRLYGIKTLIEQGKTGLAMQDFARLEKHILAKAAGAEGADYAHAVGKTLVQFQLVLDGVEPRDPLFRLKQKVEDLMIGIAPNEAVRDLMRLRTIENRLKETLFLINDDALEEALMNLTAAEQGIENVTRDIGELEDGNEQRELSARLRSLDRHAELIRDEVTERLDRMNEILEDGFTLPPDTEFPSTTTSTVPDDSASVVSPIVRITLSAQPNPVFEYGMSQLSVTAHHQDETTSQVTSGVTYTLLGSLGSVSGSTYSASTAGTVNIQAKLTTGTTTLTAETAIQVTTPVTVTSLEVIPAQGKTTLTAGESVAMTVIAHYSNQMTKNVTSGVTWNSSVLAVGMVQGTMFQSSETGDGSSVVTAYYSENGKSVEGSVIFTVIPPR